MSLLKFVKLSSTDLQAAAQAYLEQILSVSRPIAIFLFGSVAQGTAHLESDIDMLAIYRGETEAKAAQKAVWQQKSPYPMPADLVFVSLEQWQNRLQSSPLFATVQTQGILLYSTSDFEDQNP